MDIRILLGVAIMGIGLVWARPNPDRPIDSTGRTSIVVEYENGDWCELRGPGRFQLLDEWEDCGG